MMATAIVSGLGSASPYASYGWLSPRTSLGRESGDDRVGEGSKATEAVEGDFLDFEFRLGGTCTMLTADELFAEGKLVPLQADSRCLPPRAAAAAEARRPMCRGAGRMSLEAPAWSSASSDMSPRAPTCAGRWKEMMGLSRLRTSFKLALDREKSAATAAAEKKKGKKVSSSPCSRDRFSRFVPADSSPCFPLLRDADSDHMPASKRISHSSSSSSSGHDHDENPRLSLLTEKLSYSRARIRPSVNVTKTQSISPEPQPNSRVGRSAVRKAPGALTVPSTRSASVDSPRMNASGKVIYQGLGRSTSSPGGINDGQRTKYRGMEFTPVLNVPVFGLAQRSKKDKDGAAVSGTRQTTRPKTEA